MAVNSALPFARFGGCWATGRKRAMISSFAFVCGPRNSLITVVARSDTCLSGCVRNRAAAIGPRSTRDNCPALRASTNASDQSARRINWFNNVSRSEASVVFG